MKYAIALLTAATLLRVSAHAEIIFDNSENYLGTYNGTSLETGDQVQFAGEARLITFFTFEYFALPSAVANNSSARVRFYLNDGANGQNPFATPGTLLYDSGSFGIDSGYKTVEISDLAIFVPSSSLTWTVEFSGLTQADGAGALFYDPPQTGSSGDFLWQKQGSDWLAVASTGLTNNLAARFIAVAELRIKSVQAQQNGASIIATATPGRLYSLEYKSSVTQTGWITGTAAPVRATSNQVTLNDPGAAGAPLRIYRVVESDLSIERSPSNPAEFVITAAAILGRRYTLEYSEDFASWTSLGERTASTDTVIFSVSPQDSPFRFFRVSEVKGDGPK